MTGHQGTNEVESTGGTGTTNRDKKVRICAAVLAGGKSSRMGKNKALLELSSKSLIEHAVGVALQVTDAVQIITNSPKEYAFLKRPILADEIKNIGPIGGIYTALKHCETRHCLILACDLPFLTTELIRFLVENVGDADIFAIDTGKGVEPLCAVYSAACLPAIEAQIAKKDYKVAHLFAQVNTRAIRFGPAHSLYSNRLFYNVNTPEDYKEAARFLEESGDG